LSMKSANLIYVPEEKKKILRVNIYQKI
jgi:hypothetical protein